MKSLIAAAGALALAFSSGCAVTREAQLSAEEALVPRSVTEFPWGRVECGEGQVCQEVVVTRVDVHGLEDAPVEITLRNRTLESVAVQVQLETFKDGLRTDITGFHDVALAPRQESVLTLWQQLEEGEKLVVKLRSRG